MRQTEAYDNKRDVNTVQIMKKVKKAWPGEVRQFCGAARDMINGINDPGRRFRVRAVDNFPRCRVHHSVEGYIQPCPRRLLNVTGRERLFESMKRGNLGC